MLTESQYKELLRYRGYGAQYDGNLTEPLRFLLRKKYVSLYHPISSDGKISDITICAVTNIGENALEEYECNVREKRAKEETDKVKEKAQRTMNRFDTLTFGLAVAITAGLVVYYWPSIVSFFSGIVESAIEAVRFLLQIAK